VSVGGITDLSYRKVQNKIQEPARSERLIKDLIDSENASYHGRFPGSLPVPSYDA
jgi:hypothetical protein